jgi:molecular chaperone DnaK
LSLGLETLGGVMTTLIPRNTTIPTRKTEVFSTAEDSQTAVDVHVLQGERPMAKDNKTLGMFRLEGIPPAPRGIPQIEVTFDIDANGILNVTAKDKATGKEQKIQITASTNLSESEVEKMVNEAKQHESEDERQRQLIETRNQADQLIYTVEKTLNELGDKVSATDRGQVENVMNDLKEALKTDDAARIRSLTEQLQQASYAFSQQMYQTQQQGQANGSANGHGNGQTSGEDDDVIEGEFQEM